jgi:hypothetical protein
VSYYFCNLPQFPNVTPTNTPSVTATNTPTLTNTETPTNTPTLTETPTNTPTPSTSPIPVTGYGFNLIVLPYFFPVSGNTIMTNNPLNTGTTNPNELTTSGRGIYWNSIDTDGIDRTSYFSQFTGQSVTITMSQTGSTAIYSGSTNAFQNWSGTTGSSSGTTGTGFVFGTGISTVPSGFTGTTVLIQSATTNWTVGLPVYISAEINVGVTPTPTETSTNTPTPSVTNTQTPSVTPTLTQTPTNTETTTPTPTLTQTPTPTSGATAPFSVSFVESGSNILMSYSGTLDLTGLDFVENINPGSGGVGAAQGAFGIGPSGVPNVSLYTGATFSYPSNFGTGGGSPSSVTGTGDYFGVFSGLYPTNTLVVPTGYTSGNFIQGTTTLSASTFSSLGMSAGTYNYSWGAGSGQSFVLTIGGAGPTPTPTSTSVTPTPTPTSGYTGDGWLFYAPEGPITVGPPDNNGNSVFVIQSGTIVTYNPNYTGATLNIYFNSGTTLGTSYLTQFQGLDVSGGTLTASQGSNTVIYSGNSSEYAVSPTGFLQLTLNRTAQMVQSASTPFVSGTSINVVVS